MDNLSLFIFLFCTKNVLIMKPKPIKMILEFKDFKKLIELSNKQKFDVFFEKKFNVLDFDDPNMFMIVDETYHQLVDSGFLCAKCFSGRGIHIHSTYNIDIVGMDVNYHSKYIRLPGSFNTKRNIKTELLSIDNIPIEGSEYVDKNLINKICSINHPSHYQRIYLVAYLKFKGLSISETIDYIETLGWEDFQRHTTEYQVKYVFNFFKFMPSKAFVHRYNIDEDM